MDFMLSMFIIFSSVFELLVLSFLLFSFIVDTKQNLTLYLLFYFPLTIMQSTFSGIYAAIEVFLVILINYYASYFKLIQIKLNRLNEELKNITPARAKYEIIQIIKDHKMAISFVNEFENLFNIVLLANFMMNSFIISFFIFAFYEVLLLIEH